MERSTRKPVCAKMWRMVEQGGINCPCCTFGRPAVTKRFWNRIRRRVLKAQLRSEEMGDE